MMLNPGALGESQRPVPPKDPAQRIDGRFRVEAALGKGGMGTVLAVSDESSGRRLALKRLFREAGPKYIALFEREYHTLAGLKHPNIVEVFDYGRDHEGPYYTMELLAGGDLTSRAPMPWPDVVRVLRSTASALALLHARRLLHRDISPRNVWWTPEGTIKLIDFGALCAFGRAKDVIGTAPFIAPEALRGPGLDQRTDLYSLGALGYWLLTGLHAFPAREISDLERRWRTPPKPASRRIRELARDDLPEVPDEFDASIDALLSQDPLARPGSAAELIDRLDAIAPSSAEAAPVIEGHLSSGAFAGRDEQQRGLQAALKSALAGHGSALVLAAAPGLGRTRLLAEFALHARLCGALTLQVDPGLHQGELHGMAQALALKLLEALPDQARALAQPHAPVLGHLSSELCARLGLREDALATLPEAPGEGRMRMQAALCQWFLDVSQRRPIAVLADDVDAFDEASAAFLAALAHQASASKLLLVASLQTERSEQRAVETLKRTARCVALGPLTSAEMFSVLSSMFGEVPRLERLAEMLHRASEGNPAHMMELVEHLTRKQLISYADGTWVLPETLDPDALPKSRSEVLRARLERLPRAARAFGQTLSLNPRLISLEICSALSDMRAAEMFAALERMVREGVLIGSAEGYAFTHQALRRMLLDELAPERRRRAHRVLGEAMLGSAQLPALDQLQAGMHLMLGGEGARGRALVIPAARDLATTQMAHLSGAVPYLEQALALLREARRPEHEQLAPLAALASAGYYVDRKLADRYGEQALALFERAMGLARARRLKCFVGRKLGLLLSLLGTAIAFRLRQRARDALGFREAMLLLFNSVATLTGSYVLSYDPERGARTASVIEPMSVLGEDHIAGIMYRFCLNLVGTLRDRLGVAYQNWQQMVARLERPGAIPGLPESLRVFYLAGALNGQGVLASWRDDPQALACADRLDAFGLKLYEMVADQVRMMYYGNQGNLELFERYRKRVELHAIQRGTAWQVENWAAGAQITVYMRMQDGMRMKHCVEQLRRGARELASMKLYLGRAYGAYLLLRGKIREAVRWLEEGRREEPLALVGWARTHGVLACAYNLLGDHVRAREVCEFVLSKLNDEDLTFPAMNLQLSIERAIAEAGLGQVADAERRLDALIERHRPQNGPLSLAALYEARARVALVAKNEADFSRFLAAMKEVCQRTKAPALIERCERLARQSTSLSREGEGSELFSRDAQMRTVLHMIRHGGGGTVKERADWALAQFADFTRIDEGHVYLVQSEGVERVASWCRPRDGTRAILGTGSHSIAFTPSAAPGARASMAATWTAQGDQPSITDTSRVRAAASAFGVGPERPAATPSAPAAAASSEAESGIRAASAGLGAPSAGLSTRASDGAASLTPPSSCSRADPRASTPGAGSERSSLPQPANTSPLSDAERAQLDEWVAEQIHAYGVSETVTAELDELSSLHSGHEREVGPRRYRLIFLRSVERGVESLIGALVVSAEFAAELSPELLQTIAGRLQASTGEPSQRLTS